MTRLPTGSAQALRHEALLYRGADEYVRVARDCLLAGLHAGGQALVVAPTSSADAIKAALGASKGAVVFADMRSVGRNPARIMPELEAFIADGGGRPVIICESAWPGRTPAETREVARHEALANLAFAESGATILCPYDAEQLPASVIASARSTHPLVHAGGAQRASPVYSGPGAIPAESDMPLQAPPSGASVLVFRDDLHAVRDLVARQADVAGLQPLRVADLIIAVSELAANTLIHTMGQGTLRVWQTSDEVVCQVDDAGHISDPLAGRRVPDPDFKGGHGLWLVNKCCDLTQVRTDVSGTTIRLHMCLAEAENPDGRKARTGGKRI